MTNLLTSREIRELISRQPEVPKIRFSIHRKLDAMLGGVELGEIVTIAALPGAGKTSLCVSLTKDLAPHFKCLWFSFEMAPRPFLNFFGEDVPEFYMPDDITKQKTVNENLQWIGRLILEAKRERGVQVVFIDNLQDLTNFFSSNPVQMMDAIMQWLKDFFIKHQLTLFLISHIAKDKEVEIKRPTLSSIRGSQMISALSSSVLIVQRLKEKTVDAWGEHPWSNRTRIYVEKNRRTGQLGHITMTYDPSARIFSEEMPIVDTWNP